MTQRKNVLIAGLFHETNTFLEGRTRLKDFRILRGDELLTVAGDHSPLAGAIEAGERAGWQFVPAIDVRAMPGPLVEDRVIAEFWRAFVRAARRVPVPDGVLLVL